MSAGTSSTTSWCSELARCLRPMLKRVRVHPWRLSIRTGPYANSSSTSGLTLSMSQTRSVGLRSAARSWITSRRGACLLPQPLEHQRRPDAADPDLDRGLIAGRAQHHGLGLKALAPAPRTARRFTIARRAIPEACCWSTFILGPFLARPMTTANEARSNSANISGDQPRPDRRDDRRPPKKPLPH